MRAIQTILLVSLLLSGCATELDNKIRSVDQAPTMQNKRDYLLSYSEQKGYSATAARTKFLKYGSEDEALAWLEVVKQAIAEAASKSSTRKLPMMLSSKKEASAFQMKFVRRI